MSANVWFEEVNTGLIDEILKSVKVTNSLGAKVPIGEEAVIVRKPEEDFKLEVFPCVSIYNKSYYHDTVRYDPIPVKLGIDLAKKGDSTVITVVEPDWDNPVIKESNKNSTDNIEDEYTAYRTHIKDWRQLDGDDYNKQYYDILDYLRNWNVARIMIDATREESMTDRLRANLDCEVIGCNFTSIKSPMYKHLDNEIINHTTF